MLNIFESISGEEVAINARHVTTVAKNRNGTTRLSINEGMKSENLDINAPFSEVVAALNGRAEN